MATKKKKSTKKKAATKKTPHQRSVETRAKNGYPKLEMFKKILFNNPAMTPTEAVIQAGYNVKDRKVASVIAAQNLVKLNLTMSEILARMGLTDEQDAEDLLATREATKLHACDVYVKNNKGKWEINKNSNDFIEIPDHAVRLKSIELSQRIKGNLNKIEVSGKVSYDHLIVDTIRKDKNKTPKPKGD